MRVTRRQLQISLAVLWLLDGLLQCQPFMFTRGFVGSILAPAAAGQPSLVAAPMRFTTAVVSADPAVANAVFALVQLLLGLGILTRRFRRVALGASVVWALSVWVAGEGIGGIATGSTLLMGAPGAALLYAVIALLAWPTRDPAGDDRPSRWALPAWCTLWSMGAVLQLIGGNGSVSSFNMMLGGAQGSSPGWIAGIDRALVGLRLPFWTSAVMVALDVLVVAWALVPGWTRHFSLAIGVTLALTGWLLFQGLGDLTSGQSTDPNTGPLIVLLAVAVVGATSRRDLELGERGVAPTAASWVQSPRAREDLALVSAARPPR